MKSPVQPFEVVVNLLSGYVPKRLPCTDSVRLVVCGKVVTRMHQIDQLVDDTALAKRLKEALHKARDTQRARRKYRREVESGLCDTPEREAYMREYRRLHKGNAVQRSHEWDQRNPERLKERQRRWYEKNREAILARQTAYRQARKAAATAADTTVTSEVQS
jgi:hypothetical protein